ncbi:hypothetical protein CBR_g15954 [Chara braunii]|uniref:Uncharacterized protein n=1 Tax=Chara braunii TaxID=69332 RepID=A0A388JSR6_CHABU|nr:hypothetical protein CBR_g15954 [Chara braunii]|eukprot:GBG60831.1 hypothetical protein CBR_g15954 [Chara braunii]
MAASTSAVVPPPSVPPPPGAAGIFAARGGPSIPPSGNAQEESDSDRIRTLLDMCFDEGIFPESNINFGETEIVDGVGVLTLSDEVDTTTVNWLKARTVIVIFDELAINLSVNERERLIRVYEDAWYTDQTMNPTQKAGERMEKAPTLRLGLHGRRTDMQRRCTGGSQGPDWSYVTMHINSEFDYENKGEEGEARQTGGTTGENCLQNYGGERNTNEAGTTEVLQRDQIMRDPGNRTSLFAPVKTRRVGEQGTCEPTKEAEDGEGEVDYFNIISPPKQKSTVQQTGARGGGAKQACQGQGHHYVVPLCASLAPQGIKILAGKARSGEFALPAVHVDSFPGTKDAIRGAVAKFAAGRFPFRLIPGIRVGRKTVDIGEEMSLQIHLALVDIKITQDCANTLEAQGIHWLPPQWLMQTHQKRLQRSISWAA